jgi:dienelactone hydrolase
MLAFMRITALALLFACACDGAATVDAGPLDAGPTCTVLEWDRASGELTMWPEPNLLRSDPSGGLRLHFDESEYPVTANALRGYLQVFTEDLGELDGFGVNAEAYFTFGRSFDAASLPSTEETTQPNAGLGIAVLSPGTPQLWPVSIDTADDGRTLLMAPMRPLPAKATAVAFVTRALTASAGGCLEPSGAMGAVIRESEERANALVALSAISSQNDLVALNVFPTQSIEDDTIAVADDIDARAAPAFVEAPVCTTEASFVRCTARFVSQDYRDADGVFRRAAGEPATPVASYEVPVTIWLPLSGTAPYPTLLYGHGLTGDQSQGGRLAELAAPLGYATVAAPALMHGDHPTNPDPSASSLDVLFGFFAIGDLDTRALHATRLRENFRQTTWDRLQLTRLLEASPDVNGDGTADVDGARLAYLGVSLGGLMGTELLAATDAYGAGVLVVPGGRVSTIISDSPMFAALIELLRPRTTTPGDVRRFFPVLQTVLDAGDPASYGAHTLFDRFERAPRVPSILAGVVLDDAIVPNIANYALGRALGIPIVEPLLREEPGFEVVTGPIAGNFAGGLATGGLLQFDRVSDEGTVVSADHGNIGDSDVGAAAWLDFLDTHFDAPPARIRDPYAAISFPPR